MFGVQSHTLIAHFPIAFVFAAFFYDVRGFYSRTPALYEIGSSLTKLAALTAVVAAATGFSLAGFTGLGSGSAVTGHAGLGILSTIIIVTLMLVRYSAEARADSHDDTFQSTWLVIELLAVITVSATALMGHRM